AKAIVSISPRHAKSLMEVLSNSVRDYEGKFGKIEPAASPTPTDQVTMRGYS
ncbi:MAG: uncharacterized protein H6R29_22, partial [Methanomicrobia archaeon]|nr:uncharacterized protein [Methanomicrobia archaeon]